MKVSSIAQIAQMALCKREDVVFVPGCSWGCYLESGEGWIFLAPSITGKRMARQGMGSWGI
jgi:hypothetical protein